MKKSILITICVLLIAGSLSAQGWKGKGRVMGVVTDEAGAPLAGVTVKFIHTEENGGFDTNSDDEGKFTGAWLRKGAWNLDFFKVGYELKQIQIQISEVSKNPDVKIALKKTEGLMLTDDLKKELEAANALYEQENFQGAIDAFTAMLAKNPDVYILYKNIGNCYFEMEQYDKAEESYLKILEKEPANADAIVLVGNTYANRDNPDKAMEWYGKIDPTKITDATVLVNIGINFLNIGKGEEALKYFKQANVVNPNDLDALYRLGVSYISFQNNAEAIVCFENYLKIDSTSPRADQVKGFLEYLRKK